MQLCRSRQQQVQGTRSFVELVLLLTSASALCSATPIAPGTTSTCSSVYGQSGGANLCCAKVLTNLAQQTSSALGSSGLAVSGATCGDCLHSHGVCALSENNYVQLLPRLWNCFAGGDVRSVPVKVTWCEARLNGGAAAMVVLLSLLGCALLAACSCLCCPCCPLARRRAAARLAATAAPLPLGLRSCPAAPGAAYVGYGSPSHGGLMGVELSSSSSALELRPKGLAGMVPPTMPTPRPVHASPQLSPLYHGVGGSFPIRPKLGNPTELT
jgi:hypothetical protein